MHTITRIEALSKGLWPATSPINIETEGDILKSVLSNFPIMGRVKAEIVAITPRMVEVWRDGVPAEYVEVKNEAMRGGKI